MGLIRFGGQIRKFKKNESFKKSNKANRIFLAENVRFFAYYMRILAFKIVDYLI